jgi:tRNA threonylcarbamoyladenosine biosynthesis protein TsaB
MKILGVDTSTKFLCLSVYDDGKICEYNIELEKKHSKLLLLVVKSVLEALSWDIADIDYFACGIGPGSFTGVRIGVTAIKGLSFCLKKPVLGISTLDILAGNANREGIIVPAIDAKRSLIYCGIYRNSSGILKRLSPYMLLPKEEFLKKIKANSVILGDAITLYKEDFLKNIKGATILDKDYWYPKGRNIIHFALQQIKEKKFNNAFNLKPSYLYPKECQVKSVK